MTERKLKAPYIYLLSPARSNECAVRFSTGGKTMNTIQEHKFQHVGLCPRMLPCYAEMSDAQLVQTCQTKDPAAFQYLLRRYQPRVLGILYRLAPDLRDPSDLAQEVFIRLWSSIATLRNPYAFKTWLGQITTNVYYDEMRKRRPLTISFESSARLDSDEEYSVLQIADNAPLPDQCAERNELSDVLARTLRQIPDHARRMIVLRDLDGLSYQEIADTTSANLGTVKSRIARARAKMRCALQPYTSVLGGVGLKLSA
jgi:RNA polymerase sigma-70 factor (ECF subfamily)